MIDVAFSEFLFILFLAFLLIGPKELPGLLRKVGKWYGVLKRYRDSLKEQFDQLEHEIEEINVDRKNK
ncbi:MAG TPA: twin-arginine translocase TatA/TatE family subunit [Alphaproteobacteria bacterium]|nr:twin-arginine translocase TatA/TatE family subunit [Alphaproteobacteria bacterium]